MDELRSPALEDETPEEPYLYEFYVALGKAIAQAAARHAEAIDLALDFGGRDDG